MRNVLKGSVNQSVVVRFVDSVDGTPETGVVAATAGLALSYRREGGLLVALTESDLAAVDSAHSDGGIKHISDGYYRVDLPDAAFATGADGVLVTGTATGMVVVGAYVPLVDFSLAGQSAADLKDFADAGYDPATNKVEGVKLVDTTTTNTDKVSAAEIRSAVGLAAANLDTQLADLPTVTEFEARTVTAATYATAASLTIAIDHLTDIKGAGWATTDTLEAIRDRGDAAWVTATGFSTLDAAGVRAAIGLASANLDTQLAVIDDFLDTEVAAIKTKTDQLTFTTANQVDSTAVAVSDKTGYALSATGLDAIPTTAPIGVAGTFREMIVATWRRFFKKSTLSATELKTLADNGTTVLTTQAVSEVGGVQTLESAT